MLAATTPLSLQAAETITIGKGSGIQWYGLPFTVTLSGPMTDIGLWEQFGLLSISNASNQCIDTTTLRDIGGYRAYPLPGAPGVGLIPRATGSVTYLRAGRSDPSTLTGTIGLPQTGGKTSDGTILGETSGTKSWCLPPDYGSIANYYDPSYERKATIEGYWALVTDGSQKTHQIRIPRMWAGSFAILPAGDKRELILPDAIDLRISNLECSVDTPVTMNFGAVLRDLTPDAELDRITNPFNVTCGQDAAPINANINVQLRAISGLYNASPSQLSLNQGGGYITGEISGVTTDASCGGTGGLTFDNKPQKIGSISNLENSKVFNNQVIWRLCSGGSSLPTGPVDAAAELLVTYN